MRFSRLVIQLIGLALFSVGLVVVLPSVSHASVVRGSNNYAESLALGLCIGDGAGLHTRGAMWVSAAGSPYYDDVVSVTHDQRYVWVELRGSAVKCTRSNGIWSGSGEQGMSAHHIQPRGGNGYRLTNLSGASLYRGTWTASTLIPRYGQVGVWTTQGGNIRAQLDTEGLATGGEETLWIDLFRCPAGQHPPSRECYDSPQRIRIVRLPPPIQWNMTPTTSITSAPSAVGVGTTVTWQHRITNNGPNTTNAAITYRAENQGYLGGGTVGPSPWTETAIPATGSNFRQANTTHLIRQSDVGQNLCRRTVVAPRAWNNAGSLASGNACIYIPFNYNLQPIITSPSDGAIIESDVGSVEVVGRISNSGPTRSRTNIPWQLTQVKYAPGATIANKAGGTGGGPCSFFTGGNCSSLVAGTQAEGYGFGATSAENPESFRIYTSSGSLANDPPGTKVCYAISVQYYTVSASDWRHSTLHCLIVGKKPKVAVWGGNVQVGRTFTGVVNPSAMMETSLTAKAVGMHFGSWAEYGLLAPGRITSVASGSGLNMPLGTATGSQSAWSTYTFTKDGTRYGNYTAGNAALPDVTAIFPLAAAVPENNFNLSTTTKGRHIRPNPTATLLDNTVTITANEGSDTLTSGQWLVVNATGRNVTIANNLVYQNGPFTTARQIPQLIIIADTITINASVTRVDAWLIAKNDPARPTAFGAISTCEQQGTADWLSRSRGSGTNYTNAEDSRLTIAHCTQQLQINGPVMANYLYLRRTAGSGPLEDAGTPAEIINLRPDAYLWAREYMGSNRIFQTTNAKELPPRY